MARNRVHRETGDAKLGLGKPETFDFLGFTHIRRKSRRDRQSAKLQEIKDELPQRLLQPIPEQGRWLKLVRTGNYAYHAVPTNSRSLRPFRIMSSGFGGGRCGAAARSTH